MSKQAELFKSSAQELVAFEFQAFANDLHMASSEEQLNSTLTLLFRIENSRIVFIF